MLFYLYREPVYLICKNLALATSFILKLSHHIGTNFLAPNLSKQRMWLNLFSSIAYLLKHQFKAQSFFNGIKSDNIFYKPLKVYFTKSRTVSLQDLSNGNSKSCCCDHNVKKFFWQTVFYALKRMLVSISWF